MDRATLPPKIKKGSHDVITPLSGTARRLLVRRLGLPMINLCTQFEVSTIIHYEDTKGDENCEN